MHPIYAFTLTLSSVNASNTTRPVSTYGDRASQTRTTSSHPPVRTRFGSVPHLMEKMRLTDVWVDMNRDGKWKWKDGQCWRYDSPSCSTRNAASGTTMWGESDYTVHGHTVDRYNPTPLHALHTLHDDTRRYGTPEGTLTFGQPRPRIPVSAEGGNQRLGRLVVEAQVAVLAAHREG